MSIFHLHPQIQYMSRKLTYQGKALLLGFLCIALWWVLPAVVKRFSRVGVYEFQAPSWVAMSYLKDLQAYWTDRNRTENELIEAGIDLARLNAAYELRNQQTDILEREVKALEGLLDLPSLPEYRYEIARVVRRDMNAWWQQIIIRKGRRHGIREGQAVVYAGGVVGRIEQVYEHTCVVQLLSSPNFRVAAHFENDLRPIQFNGGINQILHDPKASLNNVPPDIFIPANQSIRVISSRLGGSFPDGLTLGYVQSLSPDASGLFQSGIVTIDPRLLSIREVAVLIPFHESSSMTSPK